MASESEIMKTLLL